MSRLIICGGGLAGGLAAIAIAKRRPDIDLVLVEQESRLGGNHIWSFFDSDVSADCRWLIEQIAAKRWPDHEVHFPSRHRILLIGYNSIRSDDLDAAVRSSLRPGQLLTGAAVTEIAGDHILVDGTRVDGDCIIDARGIRTMGSIDLGWQKFLGRIHRYPAGHGVPRPMIMDGTVEQRDGFRFVYLLPLTPNELLIEDTYYSSSPVLDRSRLSEAIAFAASQFGEPATIVHEEHGILPVVIGGELGDLWPAGDNVPRLGLAGGFFHPTTGYSLPDALQNAVALSGVKSVTTANVYSLLRHRADTVWKQRRFFQLLNRMLFRAADDHNRYLILEHFYRLPPKIIERFYSARLTALDKIRILSGRPPVPIGKAIAAIRAKAA